MSTNLPPEESSRVAERAEALFKEQSLQIALRTDRLFAWLMFFQWLACIFGALVITPYTWYGPASRIHIHVWASLLVGGAIASCPILLVRLRPGATSNRFVIATSQMLFSALLIDVTGGRIETHFHVFGSLAFLAFYRDWRVLVPATLVVGLDHLIRGYVWPQSVYGVLAASPWRSLEHAGWVIFEDIFLVRACIASAREMRELANKQARLEATNEIVEAQVQVRTSELKVAQRQLLDTSRQAGMAEVATGVLHNVGNVLNSVNVSASLIEETLRRSKIPCVSQAAELMMTHAHDLGEFVTRDDRGKHLSEFLLSLAETLGVEQANLKSEITSLTKGIEHIKAIVSAQQAYARVSGVVECLSIAEVVEDALRMISATLERHKIEVVRQYDSIAQATLDRQKLLQILVNLFRNAQQAICERDGEDKRITLRLCGAPSGRCLIEVADTGVGIPRENLRRIFNHGFTTKADGNGFGLHSSALGAKEMGGQLTVQSDGPGKGATFTIELPLEQKAALVGTSEVASRTEDSHDR